MDSNSVQAFEATELAVSLTAKDIHHSLAWYCDVLGFTIERKYERDEKLIAVSLRAGAVQLLLTQDNGAKGLDRTKGEGFSMQFTTRQSIDELANRIVAAGGQLEAPPADAFGARVFRLVDPDGFRLVFSSERPAR